MKIGDLVQLKSGGPVMTVAYVNGDGTEVTCNWFLDNENKKAVFHPNQLETGGGLTVLPIRNSRQ